MTIYQAQLETQKAAQEYQNSVELSHSAQTLAENEFPKIDYITQQEYVNHVTMKVKSYMK